MLIIDDKNFCALRSVFLNIHGVVRSGAACSADNAWLCSI